LFFKNTGAAKFQHVQNFGEVSRTSHFTLHFKAPYFSVIKKYSERSVFLPSSGVQKLSEAIFCLSSGVQKLSEAFFCLCFTGFGFGNPGEFFFMRGNIL